MYNNIRLVIAEIASLESNRYLGYLPQEQAEKVGALKQRLTALTVPTNPLQYEVSKMEARSLQLRLAEGKVSSIEVPHVQEVLLLLLEGQRYYLRQPMR